jgi:hypothetical protein
MVSKEELQKWDAWVDLIERPVNFMSYDNVKNLIMHPDIKPAYRLLVALALGVAKWHPRRGQNVGIGILCPLCLFFARNCTDCPINLGEDSFGDVGCDAEFHPYDKDDERELFDLVLSEYKKEYKRLEALGYPL